MLSSTIEKSLRNLCERSASGRIFLPDGSLGTVLTKSVIHDFLEEDPAVSLEELAQRVDEVHLKASKVLATLILMESTEKLADFLEIGLYDDKLPVSEQDLGSKLLAFGDKWAKDFLWKQHIFLAPIFSRGVIYGPMSPNCVLPFDQDELIGYGEFGPVYRTLIHVDHQRLQASPNGAFEVRLGNGLRASYIFPSRDIHN